MNDNIIYIDGKFYKVESILEKDDKFLITVISLCGKFKKQFLQ